MKLELYLMLEWEKDNIKTKIGRDEPILQKYFEEIGRLVSARSAIL